MIDTKTTNRIHGKKEALDAEYVVCKALGDFINDNASKCIAEHNVAEAKAWIAAQNCVNSTLARISSEYTDLIKELKNAKEEP